MLNLVIIICSSVNSLAGEMGIVYPIPPKNLLQWAILLIHQGPVNCTGVLGSGFLANPDTELRFIEMRAEI